MEIGIIGKGSTHNFKENPTMKYYNERFKDALADALEAGTEDQVLKYGTYIVDEMLREEFGDAPVRIRLVNYNSKLYYHKMVSGECIEFKLIVSF
jgi:hypothetical protein